MIYVGIDASTKTGLVMLDEAGEVLYKTTVTVVDLPDPQRFIKLAQTVVEIIQIETEKRNEFIGATAIEGFSYNSRGAGVSVQYGIGWIIREHLIRKEIPYIEPTPSAVKKFLTGKGNTKKDDMILPLNDRYGFRDSDDNVRDAYVLARIAMASDGHGKLLKYQKDVMAAIN